MPNPKSGTVTNGCWSSSKRIKGWPSRVESGKHRYSSCFLRKNFIENQQINENILSIYNAIQKARPSSVKGEYLLKISISSTMGPAIIIDRQTIR